MTVTETLANRSCKYGTIESNSKITQELMRVLIKGENYGQLTDTHIECLHMIFHKISRMVNGDVWYDDNPHDIGGYAKLLEDFVHNHNKKV